MPRPSEALGSGTLLTGGLGRGRGGLLLKLVSTCMVSAMRVSWASASCMVPMSRAAMAISTHTTVLGFCRISSLLTVSHYNGGSRTSFVQNSSLLKHYAYCEVDPSDSGSRQETYASSIVLLQSRAIPVPMSKNEQIIEI